MAGGQIWHAGSAVCATPWFGTLLHCRRYGSNDKMTRVRYMNARVEYTPEPRTQQGAKWREGDRTSEAQAMFGETRWFCLALARWKLR